MGCAVADVWGIYVLHTLQLILGPSSHKSHTSYPTAKYLMLLMDRQTHLIERHTCAQGDIDQQRENIEFSGLNHEETI